MPEDVDRGSSTGDSEQWDDGPGTHSWNTEFHVVRWQAGSEEAFTALEKHFAPLLIHRVEYRSGAWPLLAGHLDSRDIVQDTWMSFLKHGRDEYTSRGKGSFLALLRDILDKKLIDAVRRHTTLKNGEGNAGEALREDGMPNALLRPRQTPVETPTSASRASEIRSLAARVLTELDYRVWDLCAIQGYSSDEAALVICESGEDMDKSASSVRGILARVRPRLAALMQPEDST